MTLRMARSIAPCTVCVPERPRWIWNPCRRQLCVFGSQRQISIHDMALPCVWHVRTALQVNRRCVTGDPTSKGVPS